MLATVLAIIGTLLGATVSGLFQHAAAGRTERTARREQHQAAQLEAITALAVAASDHRTAMWVRGDAKFTGEPPERLRDLQARSHATRSAITRPAVALRLHVTDPAVRQAADAMVSATYAMRDAADADQLATAREDALDAHDRFVDTAALYLDQAL